MIDTNVFNFLSANVNVIAVTGQRIYPEILPEKPVFESLTFRPVDHDIDNIFGGSTGFVRSDYYVDAWASTHSEADSLAKIVRDEMKNLTGSFGGITVQQIFFTIGPITVFEHTVKAYRMTQMFSIWHGEG